MKIDNSVVMITGAASGLGRATAERLVARGARVLLVDLDATQGSALAASLGSAAHFVQADVTSDEQLDRAADVGVSQFGKLTGLVTCAGLLYAHKLIGREGRTHDAAAFERVLRVNVTGTFLAMRAVSRVILASAARETETSSDGERGVLVLVSSVAATEGQLGQLAYAASKGAVASMVLPAARELASAGVRVVAIAPAAMETPMIAAAPASVQQSLVDQTLFPRRLGKPDEFAQLVEHIFENTLINGCTLRLDGGVRMSAK